MFGTKAKLYQTGKFFKVFHEALNVIQEKETTASNACKSNSYISVDTN